ncbi:unnamed protein product [Effrenium voratum]|nr:unnamed protein product [Effrenium voratum]
MLRAARASFEDNLQQYQRALQLQKGAWQVKAVDRIRGMCVDQVWSVEEFAPLLLPQLRNSAELLSGGGPDEFPWLLLAALRSMIANNIMHALSSNPILVHTVAMAGGYMSKSRTVNLYGDFRDLHSQHNALPKHCVMWLVEVQDPSFSDLWQELHTLHRGGLPLEDVIASNRDRLWHLGQTFTMSSASQDLRVLRVSLEEEYDENSEILIPDALKPGTQVYVAFLTALHKAQFQFMSLKQLSHGPLSRPLGELMGVPCSSTQRSLWDEWQPDMAMVEAQLTEAPASRTCLAPAHRTDLLRNLTKFLPKDRVFILESGLDLEMRTKPEDASMFWQAASDEDMQQAEAHHRDLIAQLDAAIDRMGGIGADSLHALQSRTVFLWERILCVRHTIVKDFVKQRLRVLVLTSDKLRKSLGAKAAWFSGRPLSLLLQDEFENEQLLDFVTVAGHFARVMCGCDPCQLMKKQFVPHERLPVQRRGNPRPSPETTTSSDARPSVTRHDPDVTEWLDARAFTATLRTSHRLGGARKKLVDTVFPPPFAGNMEVLPQHAGQVHVIEFEDVWQELDVSQVLTSSIRSNFAWRLMTTIATHALKVSQDEHVAIISAIHFLTPEAAVGYNAGTCRGVQVRSGRSTGQPERRVLQDIEDFTVDCVLDGGPMEIATLGDG